MSTAPTSRAKGWSVPATSARAFDLVRGLDWERARVADVGAGRGAFSRLLAAWLRDERGLDPRGRVLPCDRFPAAFEVDGLDCAPLGAGGRLPYEDASLNAAVSIEVIEHVEDQFAFLRELARVVRPGGFAVVTTPNVLHVGSRVRTLLTGFPALFDPLPLATDDPQRLGGHIHPISPYFLAYGALRAGFERPTLHHDRVKSSAAALAIATGPLLLLGRAWHALRLARKRPELLAENGALLGQQASWRMLTSRTAVLLAHKPAS